MIRQVANRLVMIVAVTAFSKSMHAQFLMDYPDTSEIVKISGYIQPQFQVAQSKGVRGYSGGDFPEQVNNRFMLRRGRIRFDYVHNNKELQARAFQFALQLDGTERGVFIRDLWGKVHENKWQLFSFTTGMFARPFGFEVNLSSADRESPERGRMSQILMRTERDLGAMVSFQPQQEHHPLKGLQLDAGFFNGQGLTSLRDFDSYKDFIARASIKPQAFGDFSVSGGLSYFNGGFLQNSRYINTVTQTNGTKSFYVDSSLANIGRKAPRKYKGADFRLKWKSGQNITELRAEYWKGIQTAIAEDSETPGELPDAPYFIRNFDGGFFYLLQMLTKRHQLCIKYDWYDPNKDVSQASIQTAGGFTAADVRYNTIGVGYINYWNDNFKLVLWYDIIRNEETSLDGFAGDLKDNVFTCRLQFRF